MPEPEHPLHYLLQVDKARGLEKIIAALEISDYSLTRAARVLDVTRPSLYRWVREFDLEKEIEEKKRVFVERAIDERLAPEIEEAERGE